MERLSFTLIDELGYLTLKPEQVNAFFKLLDLRYLCLQISAPALWKQAMGWMGRCTKVMTGILLSLRLRVPAKPPMKRFWAVTAYDP